MSRVGINVLGLIGATILVITSACEARGQGTSYVVTGRVLGPDKRSLAGLSVFLDRGTNLVERYQTDSAGVFRLPLYPSEPHRATWLICPRGALPIVGKPELDEFSRGRRAVHTYDYSPWIGQDSVWRSYRQSGWSGPVPRECPRGSDIVGWRYPASTGQGSGSYTTMEPDWARYPDPPALPKN